MDYFKYDPDRTMALEILRFEQVELQEKIKDNSSIVGSGTLFVLFLKDCSRFLLCLNDWKYLLMKRLPVMTFYKKEVNTLCYSFPTLNGLYILRFSHIAHKEAVKNFDTILTHNSDFYQQSDSMFGPRSSKQQADEIQESRKKFFSQNERVDSNTGRAPTQALEVERIRKRDKLRKKILHLTGKLAQKFSRNTVQNTNLTETKSYDSLKNTSEKHTVPHFLLKREVIILYGG